MRLLENKIAVVTGGSRGIGKGIVTDYVNAGAKVVFTYRSSEEEAKAIADELGNDHVMAVKSDASVMADAQELIKATMETHGRIDILVNNAGITKDNLMLRMSEEHWDDVIRVNLKSVFNLTKSAMRPMLKQRSGSIINMSSVVGVFGNAGQANYAASKAGIIGFTKSIAKELGSRTIRCNAIAPGFIATEMTAALDDDVKANYESNIPLGSLGKTADISNACLFLGSDMSSYITGQVLSVCGGLNI
ncbi:MAG: 3-oxoacyl-[acyl-carrier-protein] reductase [Bacteroidota bacterium]